MNIFRKQGNVLVFGTLGKGMSIKAKQLNIKGELIEKDIKVSQRPQNRRREFF